MAFEYSSLAYQMSLFFSFGYLVLVDSLSLKSSWVEALETPYQLASCTVSVDGEVIPSWENHDTISTSLILGSSSFLTICD